MTDHPAEHLARTIAETAHDGQVEHWHHVAFADRPGVFSRTEDEAVRVAEREGAQFVQQRFGDRLFVWVDLAQQPRGALLGVSAVPAPEGDDHQEEKK